MEERKARDVSPLYRFDVAIEQVQEEGLQPLRLFKVLFPLWEVEVKGTHQQGLPYALIEKYIARGIYEAQLTTAGELAHFLGLDVPLIRKILAFLTAVGHIREQQGCLSLTELGIHSLRDDKKYTDKETRRKLYFEAFHLRPLKSEHYTRQVHKLSELEALRAISRYQYQKLSSTAPWRDHVVSELARRSDRASYNVPDEIHELSVLNVQPAFLPMYIIEATRQQAQSRRHYRVFTHIRDRRDHHFEELVRSYPEVLTPLLAEEELDVWRYWRDWLIGNGLENPRLERTSGGGWQVLLSAEQLQQRVAGFSLAKLGTYHLERNHCFLRIWSTDVAVRRQAACNRILRIIRNRTRSTTLQDVQELLQRFAGYLETGVLPLADLRDYAAKNTMDEMVMLLSELAGV